MSRDARHARTYRAVHSISRSCDMPVPCTRHARTHEAPFFFFFLCVCVCVCVRACVCRYTRTTPAIVGAPPQHPEADTSEPVEPVTSKEQRSRNKVPLRGSTELTVDVWTCVRERERERERDSGCESESASASESESESERARARASERERLIRTHCQPPALPRTRAVVAWRAVTKGNLGLR
jgi:hypothetical protein